MWNYDPLMASELFTLAPENLYLSKIHVACPRFALSVRFVIAVAASGLVTGQNFIGIYDGGYNLIASSADLTSQLTGATGEILADLVSPVILSPGPKFIAFLFNGTLPPTLYAAPRPNADMSLHLAAPAPRFSSFPGPFSSLPASLTAGQQMSTHSIWAGI